MRNLGKLNRIMGALVLALSLGIAPALSVQAQQAARKPATTQAKDAAEQAKPSKTETREAVAGELVTLSDAEMEKVEGGALPVAGIALGVGVAGLGVGIYNAVSGHRAHNRIRRSCSTRGR
jgi:lactobin A/cerein 7B family class IIb bacteriocin